MPGAGAAGPGLFYEFQIEKGVFVGEFVNAIPAVLPKGMYCVINPDSSSSSNNLVVPPPVVNLQVSIISVRLNPCPRRQGFFVIFSFRHPCR